MFSGVSRVLLALLAVACVSWSVLAVSASASTVPVVRCQTQFGIAGSGAGTPSRLGVAGAAGGLVAYTNTESYLLAPSGMRCSGIVAVDGGSQVVVWPAGHVRPVLHSYSEGLTLSLNPACASCKAGDACPFFPSLARRLGFPCPGGVPAGERVYHDRSNLTFFEDYPGVAGSGWPSGGPFPANGLVGYTGAGFNGAVYRSTCTLPASEHAVCTASLNDVMSRYG